MNLADIIEISKTSPALIERSKEIGKFAYPSKWDDKVPLRIRMLTTVTADFPMFFPDAADLITIAKNEYYCYVNRYGALSAILYDGRKLGLKPDEFEVIEFHP